MKAGGGRLRVGVVLDAAVEGWRSMDYVGEMLVRTLREGHSTDLEVATIRPRALRVFGALTGPALAARRNADRLITRCAVYPLAAWLTRGNLDVFHIADHSYAHAAHALPPHRTGIYCHDLEALAPLYVVAVRQPLWRRLLATSIAHALRRAALVFYSTTHVREQLVASGLVAEDRLVHAPYGVAPEFHFSPTVVPKGVSSHQRGPYLLNVGSEAPRKRLDLLFRAFAAIRAKVPGLVLVQQGATLSAAQKELIVNLGLASSIVQPPALSRERLADLYRGALLVVLPSEREGFGLPLIEALACGAPVLASDIPAFREVGGNAASYCKSNHSDDWAKILIGLTLSPAATAPLQARLERASLFTWAEHTRTIAERYLALA